MSSLFCCRRRPNPASSNTQAARLPAEQRRGSFLATLTAVRIALCRGDTNGAKELADAIPCAEDLGNVSRRGLEKLQSEKTKAYWRIERYRVKDYASATTR